MIRVRKKSCFWGERSDQWQTFNFLWNSIHWWIVRPATCTEVNLDSFILCSRYHGKITVRRGLSVCLLSLWVSEAREEECVEFGDELWLLCLGRQSVLYGMKKCSAFMWYSESFSMIVRDAWARGERWDECDVCGWTFDGISSNLDTEGWYKWGQACGEDPALRISSLVCFWLRLMWTALIKLLFEQVMLFPLTSFV